MKNKFYATAIAASAALFLSVSSFAASLTFNLAWSGDSFGSSASATASITLDDSVLLNPGDNQSFITPGFITDFSVTVVNATSGNGTWILSDFQNIIWQTPTELDLTQELVGQSTNQDPWGTSLPGNTGGDFNLFGGPNGAPEGTYYFELTTNSGLGDRMLLTSFAPVPLPAAFWFLLSGVIALAAKARK